MTQLTIALLMVTGVLALLDWRKGLAMCVLVGIAQDPLRKLAPGQPLFYVLLVGVIFGFAWLRAMFMRVPLGPGVIHGWKRDLKLPFSIFIALVLAQALHSFGRYGSFLLSGIGLLVWLAPIPAVVFAYQFASRKGLLGVRKWMRLYVAVGMVALSGVFLEYNGLAWRTLGEIGEGQIIYDMGTVLKAHSGFFRASEIAAWHAAAVSCFIFILAVGKRPTVIRVAGALGLIAILVSLGILTGRRKMLVEITIFISFYLFLVAWLQRGLARLGMVALMLGAVGYIAIIGFVEPDPVQRVYTRPVTEEGRLAGYTGRGQTVFEDLPRRVSELGVQPVVWAIQGYGWFGAGLGTGSQGTNRITDELHIDRGAAEGGLGKVTLELGIPGLFMVVWLLKALAQHLHGQLAFTAQLSPPHARVSYGLVAFLAANAATFSVATQAYSDPFILLILGWCLGFLLAMPVLAARGDRVKRRSTYSSFGPVTQPAAVMYSRPGEPALGQGRQ